MADRGRPWPRRATHSCDALALFAGNATVDALARSSLCRRAMPTPFSALVLALLTLAVPLAFFASIPLVAAAAAAVPLVLALPRNVRPFAVALVLMQYARISNALALHGDEASRLRVAFANSIQCEVFGEVRSATTLRESRFTWELRVSKGTCSEPSASAQLADLTVRVTSDDGGIRRGDSVSVSGPFAATRSIRAPWEPPARFVEARGAPVVFARAETLVIHAQEGGFFAHIDGLRAALRTFYMEHLETRSAALVRALVLAEVDLPEDVTFAFKRSGLSHVLAVSGMHLTLVAAAALHGSRIFLRRFAALSALAPASAVATIPAAFVATAYAALTGFGGSSVRALAMLAVHASLTVAGRRPSGASSLAASTLIVSLVDPLAMTDLSTALSVAATAALVLAGSAFARSIPGPRVIATALGASLAATAGTAPVLTAFALPIPLAGIAANLVAVPLGEAVALPFALAGSVAALCTHPLSIASARALLAIASAGLDLVTRVASFAAQLHAALIFVPLPSPATSSTLVVGAGFVIALRAPRLRRWAFAVTACAALAGEAIVRIGGDDRLLRLTHLDVGQGDATVVEFPRGPLWLIDGGGQIGTTFDVGERTVVPAIVQARRAPEVVVLTHPHPDHFGGLKAVLRDRTPKELWDTGQGEHEGVGGAYTDLLALARAKGVIVRRPEELCGTHRVGDATVQVLAPCPGPTSDRGPNDNSFVLRILYENRSVLLTGDAEHELEEELTGSHGARELRSEVLKVAHHGSRTSTSPEFLDAVAPLFSIISAGPRNRFGHPHAVTLEHLADRGITVFRTDQLGSVRGETRGDSWHFGAFTFSGRAHRGAW